MDEVTNILIGSNLIIVVWNVGIFWLILINPFLPDLFTSVNLVWKLLKEEGMLIGKLVLGESLQVQPLFLLHP
jgi:hypothetical protein